jgi:uncharacterized protein Yka (UPF0111/DUF47 family)
MSAHNNSALSKVVGRIFPKVPDFFALLVDQTAMAVLATTALADYMETGNVEAAERVLALEHEGDALKDRNFDTLNQAFSTPMDREDLYRAIATIDHVLNYAKTTVREMQMLGVKPDETTLELAGYLRDGAVALDAGYRALATSPASAEGYAQAARKAERNCEKAYRRALAALFDVEQEVAAMHDMEGPTGPAALTRVMDVFKKREVYRHLSNGADRVARAGEVLRDIVVKLI